MTAHERPARTRSGGGLPRGDGDEGVGEVAAVQSAYGRLCVQDHHPDVGDVTLGYQSMRLEGTLDHRLVVYHAEPATPEHDAPVPLDTAAHEHAPARADLQGTPFHDDAGLAVVLTDSSTAGHTAECDTAEC